MKNNVILRLRGEQTYPEQEPEIIELVTEGRMEYRDGGWDLSYEESDLTGMQGVTTEFRVEPGSIILTRKGSLSSQMIFREGFFHESLYRMEFGALMITVCASRISYDLTEAGGTIDLKYAIDIENTAAGVIEYHLEITENNRT